MVANQIISAMMELVKKEMADTLTFQRQADDVYNDTLVQDTWYPVLDTQRNARIVGMGLSIDTADETLEVRFTVDGQVFTGTIVATYGDLYYVHVRTTDTTTQIYIDGTEDDKAFLMEGRTIKVEVRKTTANGAGTLTAAVGWDQRTIPTT